VDLLPFDLLRQRYARASLALLLGHYRCAALLGGSPWDFPVGLETLEDAGLTGEVVQLLVRDGHLSERPCGAVVLTPAGAALAEVLLGGPPAQVRPRWDGSRRLWYGALLVKEFSREAPDQRTLLDALERAGWPDVFTNPLLGGSPAECRLRLRQTVKSLNRRRASLVLHFQAIRGGQALRWRALPERGAASARANAP
jgi:hypothetical protein